MKLLVTGATGFVGSHFLNECSRRNWTTLALKRSPESITRVPLLSEPTWISKPLLDVCESDFLGVDIIVHLAAHTPNVPYANLADSIYHNVTVPLNVFEKARRSGVSKFVVIGTALSMEIAAYVMKNTCQCSIRANQ